MKTSYTYIMSNFARTVFYVGMCDDVHIRISQHKAGLGGAFTSKYKCYYLVHLETFHDIRYAIDREKQLKRWHREWKINLIRQENPDMKDLAEDWY